MINGTFLSVPPGEKSEKSERRMVVNGNTFFQVDNSSLCHPQGVGFQGAGNGISEQKL